MKTCSLYGFIMALVGAILVLVLYFLGYHSDPAKLPAAKMIGGLAGTLSCVVILVLGIRARRAEVPVTEEFGYGSALGAGVLIGLVNAVLTAIFNYVYNAYINTGFSEIIVQDSLDKMQAKGISGAQADNVEKGIRFMSSPAMQAVIGLVFGFIFVVILALIVAAFIRRPAPVAAGKPA